MDKRATHLKIAWRRLTRRPGRITGCLLSVTTVVTAVRAVDTTVLRPPPCPHAGLGATFIEPLRALRAD